jgi:putative transposase
LELDVEKRKLLITPAHADLSIRQQCELLNINRSSLYYKEEEESNYNLLLMNLIDEEYTRHPFIGVIKMTKHLEDLGYRVNEKRVRRLTRLMGILAVYPRKKNLSKANLEHKIYPYLLKDVIIERPNQVWSTDITYIKLMHGFIYLVAVLDWYSRFVLSWRISNTLDTGFCIEALEEAIALYGRADIFNTDQGSQFTSNNFTKILLANGMRISMDGRGRAFDNIFNERLWRTVKYEEVFINAYRAVLEAKDRLGKYFYFYDYERHHQALGYKKPAEVYFGKRY